MRFEQPENLVITSIQEDVRPGDHISDEHVKNMDINEVDVSVIYPTVGLLLYSVQDSALLTEIFRT